MLLSCQDKILPGNDYTEKYVNAVKVGFDSVEINGSRQAPLEDRVKEIKSASLESGIFPSTVCGGYEGWIADFDSSKRENCLRQIKRMMPAMAEIGAEGIIVPAAYGMFSRVLPPFMPPRSGADDFSILTESLTELGEEALQYSVSVYLEPLNRYEDHMVNTVEQAVELAKTVGLPSVFVMLDLFHGNIEETDLVTTIEGYTKYIRHIHLADTNRLQPGKGHLAYASIFDSLKNKNYTGYYAFECSVLGEGLEPLNEAVKYIRAFE